MENTKKQVGSSSSFTSELFGTKDSSTNDVFASIFPPAKGMGGNSARQPSGYQTWNSKQDNMDRNRDGGRHNALNNEKNTVYQGESAEPSYLSSSLFYGGQEMYSPHSQYSHPSTTSHSTFKKDGSEDDLSSASRGNWWQGSLYY